MRVSDNSSWENTVRASSRCIRDYTPLKLEILLSIEYRFSKNWATSDYLYKAPSCSVLMEFGSATRALTAASANSVTYYLNSIIAYPPESHMRHRPI